MISLDDFSSDFVALVRAGCTVRFDPTESAFGVVYVRVTVPPRVSEPRAALDELYAVGVGGGRASVPIIGQVPLLDPGNALAEFFAEARALLIGAPRVT